LTTVTQRYREVPIRLIVDFDPESGSVIRARGVTMRVISTVDATVREEVEFDVMPWIKANRAKDGTVGINFADGGRWLPSARIGK
jgi:hypothetical protein